MLVVHRERPNIEFFVFDLKVLFRSQFVGAGEAIEGVGQPFPKNDLVKFSCRRDQISVAKIFSAGAVGGHIREGRYDLTRKDKKTG